MSTVTKTPSPAVNAVFLALVALGGVLIVAGVAAFFLAGPGLLILLAGCVFVGLGFVIRAVSTSSTGF